MTASSPFKKKLQRLDQTTTCNFFCIFEKNYNYWIKCKLSKSKFIRTGLLSSVTIHRFPPLNYDLFQNINDLPFTAHKDANSLAIVIPRGWFGESGNANVLFLRYRGNWKNFRAYFVLYLMSVWKFFFTQKKKKSKNLKTRIQSCAKKYIKLGCMV